MLRTLLKRELKLGTACSAKTFYTSVQVLFSDVSILWCSKRPKKNFWYVHSTDRGQAGHETRGKYILKPYTCKSLMLLSYNTCKPLVTVIGWKITSYTHYTGRQLDAGIVWGGGRPPTGLLQYLWIFFANFLWSLAELVIFNKNILCGWESWFQVFCLAINYLDRFLAVCNIRR